METTDTTRKRPWHSTRRIWTGFVVWCLIFGALLATTFLKLGALPEPVLLPLALVNILLVILVVVLGRRANLRKIQVETPDEKKLRLLHARRGLRKGAALYGFILLWDVYLISKGNFSVQGVVIAVSINLLLLWGIIATIRKVNRRLAADDPSSHPE